MIGHPAPAALVSIHATLAGGDSSSVAPNESSSSFYPRHPRGWRQPHALSVLKRYSFLSTPPSRVATRTKSALTAGPSCFYPRHPRGWRRRERVRQGKPRNVSIHATLAGGDSYGAGRATNRKPFLSTPPSRVATTYRHIAGIVMEVSIHATLAGGDWENCAGKPRRSSFLSTPPSRVATDKTLGEVQDPEVSIHATLAGGDRK